MEKMIDISGDLIDNEKNVYEKYFEELKEKRWICAKCGELYYDTEFSKDEDCEICDECCDKAFEINEKIKMEV